MKIISRDSKVLNFTHLDWDGSMCSIILGHVYQNLNIIDTSFYKIDALMESLDYSNYDYVILTDIHPDNKELLNLSDNIIMIDHHESAIEYNNPSKMHYVIPGVCGAVLTKRFVEKMYGIKLSFLDEIVKYTNDYDMWELKYPRSKLLNDVMFYLYRPKKFREKFFDGRTNFTSEEEDWLKQRDIKFAELYDSLDVYEFDKIPGCITESREFINEICHKLMEEEGYKFVVVRNPSSGRVSIRHNIDELDIGTFLKEKGWGGGHCYAGGAWIGNNEEYKNKLLIIEKYVKEFIK
jgi:oligoribonuclease NrnB/cAMP/cGMP phosphodiesterase (DHH superfamily)